MTVKLRDICLGSYQPRCHLGSPIPAPSGSAGVRHTGAGTNTRSARQSCADRCRDSVDRPALPPAAASALLQNVRLPHMAQLSRRATATCQWQRGEAE